MNKIKGKIATVSDFFKVGMKRKTSLETPPPGIVLNLGAGEHHIYKADNLDLPDWDARYSELPYEDESVAVVHCHHFLEHIPNVTELLWEIQRVLVPDGVVYITVPFWRSKMAHQDINHINTFSLDTWKELFSNPFYKTSEKSDWQFVIKLNVIMGITEGNLAILTQLVKK
jgi:SAM-dependent methyltransferase